VLNTLLHSSLNKVVDVADLEHALRTSGIGTFKVMRPAEEPKYDVKDQARGLGKRMSPDILWRVSTRKELVSHFHATSMATYKNLAIAVVSLFAAFYCFSLYSQTHDLAFAFFAIVFGAMVSRHYTKAVGGYAGGWSDYEHDPVQVLPHNSYVLNKGFGLM